MIAKTKNARYEVISRSTTKLHLSHDKFCWINTDDIPLITQHKWKARKSRHCWYAVRSIGTNGKKTTLSLHRFLMCTPKDLECHHGNFDSLDNRRFNLTNLTKTNHKLLHSLRRITAKNVESPPKKL